MLVDLSQVNGSMKEQNKFHEKITRKASDAAEYIELFGSSTRNRHARRINVILWTSADIRRREWWSRVEEPNNSI